MIEDLKVQERAYELWERDGRPEGSDEFYWRLAQEQLKAEATPEPVPIKGESGLDQASPTQQAPEDIEQTAHSEWPARRS